MTPRPARTPAPARDDRILAICELICDRTLTAITATLTLMTVTSNQADLAWWWWS